jgi:hypothetical protein
VQFKAEVVGEGSYRLVRLVGRLQREHLAELMGLCAGPAESVRLDLTDLVSADESGLQALLSMRQRGINLRDESPLIALQLERARPERDPPPPAYRRRPASRTGRTSDHPFSEDKR